MPHRTHDIGAIVLAAGRSTRFRSARSKLVHTLGGRPIIQWPLTALRNVGVSPVVVVVAPDADEVRATCGPGISFAVQETPRGTGHAVLAAEPALAGFTGSLILLYGDLPLLRADTIARLCDVHCASGGVLTLLTATVADPHGWGRIVRRDGAVSAIVEERDCTPAQRALREVNVGVYCARAAAVRHAAPGAAEQRAGRDLPHRHRRTGGGCRRTRGGRAGRHCRSGPNQLARRAGSDGEIAARTDQCEVDGGRGDA